MSLTNGLGLHFGMEVPLCGKLLKKTERKQTQKQHQLGFYSVLSGTY